MSLQQVYGQMTHFVYICRTSIYHKHLNNYTRSLVVISTNKAQTIYCVCLCFVRLCAD